LYNTVFTDPTDPSCAIVLTKYWSRAYDFIRQIDGSLPRESEHSTPLELHKEILLRNDEELYLAWMLTCFVPWARILAKPPKKPTSKRLPSPAYLAAREGIKAGNKVCKVIDDAANHLADIIALKDASNAPSEGTETSLKRKHSTGSREIQGQAIRAWGSHWRCSVMYALLTQIKEASSKEGKTIFGGRTDGS